MKDGNVGRNKVCEMRRQLFEGNNLIQIVMLENAQQFMRRKMNPEPSVIEVVSSFQAKAEEIAIVRGYKKRNKGLFHSFNQYWIIQEKLKYKIKSTFEKKGEHQNQIKFTGMMYEEYTFIDQNVEHVLMRKNIKFDQGGTTAEIIDLYIYGRIQGNINQDAKYMPDHQILKSFLSLTDYRELLPTFQLPKEVEEFQLECLNYLNEKLNRQ